MDPPDSSHGAMKLASRASERDRLYSSMTAGQHASPNVFAGIVSVLWLQPRPPARVPLWLLHEQVRLEPLSERDRRGSRVVEDQVIAAAVAEAPRVPGPGRVAEAVAVGPGHQLVDVVVGAGVLADLADHHRGGPGDRADRAVPARLGHARI